MRNLALVWVLAGVAVVLLAAGDGKPPVSTFTDKRDGKVYKIVKIGSQTWFAENLNYAAKGSECYNNSPDSCAKYGRLYNWETALTACPAGTHLPTYEEWTTLASYIYGEKKTVNNLKSSTGWYRNGTDDYGFSALPSGHGKVGGKCFDCDTSKVRFCNVGNVAFWWSATEYNDDDAVYGAIEDSEFEYNYVYRDYVRKTSWFSVRCVLDDEKERRK